MRCKSEEEVKSIKKMIEVGRIQRKKAAQRRKEQREARAVKHRNLAA